MWPVKSDGTKPRFYFVQRESLRLETSELNWLNVQSASLSTIAHLTFCSRDSANLT